LAVGKEEASNTLAMAENGLEMDMVIFIIFDYMIRSKAQAST
jgi:hypothetical protein